MSFDRSAKTASTSSWPVLPRDSAISSAVRSHIAVRMRPGITELMSTPSAAYFRASALVAAASAALVAA